MTEKTHGALAIFVRSPQASQTHHRLSKTLGKIAAETFHHLSAQAMESVALEAQRESPELFISYWALDEHVQPDSQWKNFAVISQGEGTLGERYCRVYNELLRLHKYVLIMSIDSPQLAPEDLTRAAELASNLEDVILGPTEHGGFYIFGGSKPIPVEVWNAIPFDVRDTIKVMRELMGHFGKVVELSKHYDVDSMDDLQTLELDFATKLHQLGRDSLLPEQVLVFNWVRGITAQYGVH